MRLYYIPGSCSMAPHIALREAGLDFELDKVDTSKGKTESGEDFSMVNPKGVVPVLKLDDGTILTEASSILQYVADNYCIGQPMPAAGTVERARIVEHLNYTSTEVHKSFGPFFRDGSTDEQKEAAGAMVAKKFDYLDRLFSDGRTHLLGEDFTIADIYLFVVSNWANFVGIDLAKWQNLKAFVERIATRPSAQAAMAAEGLG